jgi:hypothetical protein
MMMPYADFEQYPDDYQYERAARFGCDFYNWRCAQASKYHS